MWSLTSEARGVPLGYHVLIIGADAWICSAAGSGTQNTYTQIYCLNPHDPSQNKFIDVLKKTINGIAQHDPHWPTSAAGQTIGIHSMYGSAAGAWLDVGFVHHSWGGSGDSVFNLSTNTWSLLTKANMYSSGHSSIGGKFVNGSGSINGMDSRALPSQIRVTSWMPRSTPLSSSRRRPHGMT